MYKHAYNDDTYTVRAPSQLVVSLAMVAIDAESFSARPLCVPSSQSLNQGWPVRASHPVET